MTIAAVRPSWLFRRGGIDHGVCGQGRATLQVPYTRFGAVVRASRRHAHQ